ncbi:hypothetical protein KQX54_013679 [Cotesia glomerata]|uniref:Uncharacterized protein n=1 Tax=Cotesia glomerata TaxID=32391 RepID=A0AAV7IDN4_COTGL|nr:hypothetical protein KQX54_013679 [Cotesia glomerata]
MPGKYRNHSVEELEDPELRVRIPEIKNLSSLESSSSSEEETDLTKTKRNRKVSQLTLKKKKVDDILRANKSATHIRESSPKDIEFDEENRDLDNHDKAEVPEADNQKKFDVIPESDEGLLYYCLLVSS